MKKYHVIALLLLCVLLLAVVFQQQPTSTSQTLPQWSAWKIEAVTQLEIQHQGQMILHAKLSPQGWLRADAAHQGESLAVKQAAVEQLLDNLHAMKAKRVASMKAAQHGLFAVGEHGYQLRLLAKDGQDVLHVFVGKTGNDLRSTYIRFAGEDAVFSVNQVLTWQVRRTAKSWLKPMIEEHAP